MLSVGDTAPDFVLPGTDGERIGRYTLVDLLQRGPVVVSFYRFDFHPTCTEFLRSLRDAEWERDAPDGTVLGISTDSAFSHRAFAREHGIEFPLLSDDTGTVSETYGVLSRDVAPHGFAANRALVVVDADWTVRYAWAADDPDELPNLDPVTETLGSLG